MDKAEIKNATKEEIMQEFSKILYKKENFHCSDCSVCSDCSYCSYCFNCFNCSYCFNCFNCSVCSNCSYCSYCFGCFDRSYKILNIQFSKKEYKEIMEKWRN